MSPETHQSFKQTRSENSKPTLEMAEPKEKVQSKETELKQSRKPKCDEEETSKTVVNPLKIKKDKMGSAETDPKVIPHYTLDQARKHLLQREQSHKVQIKKKESLLDEETKSVNGKTEASPKAESNLQIQQMKAKNDLQIQKTEVDFEMEVSKTKDQVDEKLITKLLICGISLLSGFPNGYMLDLALEAKNISLSSHRHH